MEKEYEFLPWLPQDAQRQILTYITEPEEIIKLSQMTDELKNLLKLSITKLTSDKNPLYLNADWLTDYPFLESVDDNIVFEVTNDNVFDIKIPLHLKKFNLVINNKILQKGDEDFLLFKRTFIFILQQLKSKLTEYTIRFIFEYGFVSHHDLLRNGTCFAIIIDQGYHYPLINFRNNSQLLRELHSMTINLESLELYKHDLIDYFETTVTTNDIFDEFVFDISEKLEIDLFALMPTYLKTGLILYEHKHDVIFAILTKYLEKYKLLRAPLDPTDVTPVKVDSLLIKYQKGLMLANDFTTIDWIDRDQSLFYDKNMPIINLITHLHLTDPSIYGLLIADYYNICNLKV